MTPSEAAAVLAFAAAFDHRTVGEADAHAWAMALPHINDQEARDAVVEHYRETRDWIMPSDIERIVRRRNVDRARMLPTPPTPPRDLADEPKREIEWQRIWADAFITGHTEDKSREIANRQMQVTEDEQLAITGGPGADLKAQMERDLLELTRKQSLAESERLEAIAAKRERAKKIRAAELALREQHAAEQRETYREERERNTPTEAAPATDDREDTA